MSKISSSRIPMHEDQPVRLCKTRANHRALATDVPLGIQYRAPVRGYKAQGTSIKEDVDDEASYHQDYPCMKTSQYDYVRLV